MTVEIRDNRNAARRDAYRVLACGRRTQMYDERGVPRDGSTLRRKDPLERLVAAASGDNQREHQDCGGRKARSRARAGRSCSNRRGF
jgi:hypothetical protein